MTMLRFAAPISVAFALALTLTAGFLHGRLSHRWGTSTALAEAGRRLEQNVPVACGKWHLKTKEKLDEDSTRQLQCVGQHSGVYEHEETGESVSIFIIVGPMGPTAEHTPEVCFPSRSFRQIGSRTRTTVETSEEQGGPQFWMATFEPKSVEGGYIRSYWSWTADGHWQAADNPRLTYIRAPYLYKIQVQGTLRSEPSADTHDPCRDFLSEFLAASQDIFPSSTSPLPK